jgi:amino-acid N-acetyltransferase
LALDDFVVATDAHGHVLACGALKMYSPSLAEVASVAVVRGMHGRGLGSLVVTEVEQLAYARGVSELFAITLTPQFFESLGYERSDRSLYPEKLRRDCATCPRKFGGPEACMRRAMGSELRVYIPPHTRLRTAELARAGGAVAAELFRVEGAIAAFVAERLEELGGERYREELGDSARVREVLHPRHYHRPQAAAVHPASYRDRRHLGERRGVHLECTAREHMIVRVGHYDEIIERQLYGLRRAR